MTSDSAIPLTPSPPSPPLAAVNCHVQIRLKSQGEKLLLILPPENQNPLNSDWVHIWQDLKSRLHASDRSWQPKTAVHLIAKDRLIDGRHLQTLAKMLMEVQLELKSISTQRRQTAVAAATAGYSVEQDNVNQPLLIEEKQSQTLLADPLYLQTTIRSGAEIRHPGTVIIQGDINPGGIVVAAGDILVWGTLRGIAHAGAQGNRDCRIMALKMEPTQLRIADIMARAPESSPDLFEPEIAYIAQDGIRIAKAHNLAKNSSFFRGIGGS